MTHLFHVTSTLNRETILAHGLDWTRMGRPGVSPEPGARGSGRVLVPGRIRGRLLRADEQHRRPVDVWSVTGIDEQHLISTGSGFRYFPARIPRSQVTLADWPSDEPGPPVFPCAAPDTAPVAPTRRRRTTLRPVRTLDALAC